MVQVACVRYNTITDRDYSIESLVNERITKFKQRIKVKLLM